MVKGSTLVVFSAIKRPCFVLGHSGVHIHRMSGDSDLQCTTCEHIYKVCVEQNEHLRMGSLPIY